jgi:cysteinyl-tRNA synthetase
MWKLEDRETLRKEVEQKKETERLKIEAKLKLEQKEKEEKERAKIPPEQFFAKDPAFSAFDAKGLPTMDAEGKPVSKSALKKLQKEWEKQAKMHEQWKSSQSNNNN